MAEFRLDISREEMLLYYAGQGSRVVVRSRDGLWIQLPAGRLRTFVNHDGVHGLFRLYYDESGRIEYLQKIRA
ncbi:DUF2835 family protein [Aquisalimonas lutea]|uniref:DUF2835 family protein n=1 Tax=Aquisalimonas lutea TaxID=1327750 RepID=UPI0025B2AB0B|nr:DUF2835 family protein [Aquisalimonas lutea]MDN3516251.1 DUF2835 family protein [Aquisalimonas lutea]